jgi:hypothetical protein
MLGKINERDKEWWIKEWDTEYGPYPSEEIAKAVLNQNGGLL